MKNQAERIDSPSNYQPGYNLGSRMGTFGITPHSLAPGEGASERDTWLAGAAGGAEFIQPSWISKVLSLHIGCISKSALKLEPRKCANTKRQVLELEQGTVPAK